MNPVSEEKLITPKAANLEWLQLSADLDENTPASETTSNKVIRKSMENPLVPIGLLATCAALGMGLRAMRSGNRVQSQKMMRLRIGAQGFTVVALLAGILITNFRNKE